MPTARKCLERAVIFSMLHVAHFEVRPLVQTSRNEKIANTCFLGDDSKYQYL